MTCRRPLHRWYLFYALLCSLWLNSFVPYLTNAAVLQAANNGEHGDAVLLCTGKQYLWVSLSVFEQTGQLQQVAAPEDASPNQTEHACPLGLLADVPQFSLLPQVLHSAPLQIETDILLALPELTLPGKAFVLPRYRAPPAFLA